MSLLSSPEAGHAVLGWRRIAVTAAVFCLLPALVGAGLVLASLVFGQEILGQDYLRVEGFATFAMISPLLTGPVWAVIGLGAAYLLKLGWFGSLPAAALGAAAYGMVAWMGDLGPFLVGFGAVSALIYRMALALQRPEAV
jgi:hypothetical protein